MSNITITAMERRNAYVDGLSNLAEFLEHLEMLNPEALPAGYSGVHIFKACDDMETFSSYVKLLGDCEKYSDDISIGVKKYFGPHVFDLHIMKVNSCEKVIVGIEHVEEKVIPAHDREIVEWICPPSFLSPSSDAL